MAEGRGVLEEYDDYRYAKSKQTVDKVVYSEYKPIIPECKSNGCSLISSIPEWLEWLDRQPTTSEGSNQRVRCREDHVARQPNEISCPAGAIVEVVRRDIISGWWLVCYCDQVGKIPSMKLALDDVLWRNQTATSAGPVSSQISPRLDSHRGSPHLSRLRSRILTSRDIQPQQSSSLSVSRSDENLHQRQRGSQATLGTGTEDSGHHYHTAQSHHLSETEPYVARAVLQHSEMEEDSQTADLHIYDWFHGKLSRQIAEARLTYFGIHGSFLVRESMGVSRQFAVSIRSGNNIYHFRIYESSTGGFFINRGELPCGCLPSLIMRHTRHPIIGTKPGSQFTLLEPLSSAQCAVMGGMKTPDGYEVMSLSPPSSSNSDIVGSNHFGRVESDLASRRSQSPFAY